METSFATAMGRALRYTRAGDTMAATRLIQEALAGQETVWPADHDSARAGTFRTPQGFVEDAEVVEDDPAGSSHPGGIRSDQQADWRNYRRSLKDVIAALRKGREGILPTMRDQGRRPPPPVPDGARFESRTFACQHGAREYRLYVPASLGSGDKPNGLILMLHGCTQDPEDFASGTGMNDQAERHRLIIAYPHQAQAHNAMGCWNWFRPSDQHAAAGEPAILAGLARELAAEFRIDPDRIFAAGLSAGGAMAAILGTKHSATFCAVGVHSGLPHGAAHDVLSAFAAMRGETVASAPQPIPSRTIVFHGSADTTVHPANADALFTAAGVEPDCVTREGGRAPGGRTYMRDRHRRSDGTAQAELWRIDGAGHAWSGGRPTGSYTDPAGPDASAEMVRFFLELDHGVQP